MTNQLPTIDIKGKQYVLVKDRILAFNEMYPNGSIETELISPTEATTIIMKAIVTPDVKNPTRRFVDYSQAKIGQGMVNTTAALENASTSAVGRCMAYLGIGIIESIASADEVVKAISQPIQKDPEWIEETPAKKCSIHNVPLLRGVSKVKFDKEGNPKTYWYHQNGTSMCFGHSEQKENTE